MANSEEIRVPDIGDFEAVDVLEVLVSPGDRVEVDQSLLTLESDKASMDVPSPRAGVVREVKVAAGDQVSQGDVILLLEAGEEGGEADDEPADSGGDEPAEDGEPAARAGEPSEEDAEPPAAEEDEPAEPAEPDEDDDEPAEPDDAVKPGKGAETEEEDEDEPPASAAPATGEIDEKSFATAYASPSVRRFARELGVDLGRVEGSGRKGRILREDVQAFVKKSLAGGAGRAAAGPAPGAAGTLAVAPAPEIDFSAFGEVETEPLTKVQKLTGANLHRSWVTIPHVTQFDEADVTELEAFRKGLADEAAKREVKLTPLPFLIKAAVAALREFPRFNASLAPDGEHLVLKKYFHVGIAVDTPQGLVVPVIRDADRKGLYELAAELADLAARARERKLKPDEMRGGSFTISSLGSIGGTAFTPIINPPEVAILGVSRTSRRPVWQDGEWVPRLVLPFSLSYDHRVIDGVAAARFTGYLATVLGDLRRLLL